MDDTGSVLANAEAPATAGKVTDEEHQMLVQWFEDAEEACRDARDLAHKCRDYYDSKQLTEAEKSTLSKRGQPPVIFNRVASKINFMLGLEQQQRTDPKAAPRTPEHEDSSEAVTDALRYVEERERLDNSLSVTHEDMIIEGLCGVEIGVKDVRDPQKDQLDPFTGEVAQKGYKKEIDVKLWRYDRLFFDPHSQRHDFSDARYRGGVIWMDRSTAEARWPNAKVAFDATFQEAFDDQTYADKPSWKQWSQTSDKRSRVRVVQIYWQSGNTWKWAIYCRGGVLEGGEVPYLDSNGEPECPLELQSCFVDRENNRYGVVKALLDPQDEINHRRSKLLHLMNMRQTKYEVGAVDDADELSRQLARPDGQIEYNPGFDFEIVPTHDIASGQVQLLQHAQAEMDEMGANNALRGVTGNQASGRAIQASQQGGQLELAVVQDRHRDLKLRVYRQVYNRIRQFWTEERWVRVTDNEQNAKFAQLNAPITLRDKLIEQADKQGEEMEKNGANPQQIEQFYQKTAQQIEAQYAPEQLDQVIGRKNNPAEMDMDIILDMGPDTTTIQSEQFQELTKLLATGMELQDPRLRILIAASQLRGKKELLKQIDDAQRENPAQKKMQALQLQDAEAEGQKKLAEVKETEASAMQKAAQARKIEAETGNVAVNTEINKQDALDGQMNGGLGPQ